MALINTVISWLMKKRFHQIELFMKYPHEVQQEVFQRLIRHGRNTEWGRKWDYDTIETPEQFRSRIPVSRYDDLKPWIDRLRKGEQNLLWDSEIRFFAKSSGTTADRSKYIPVSQEALEECHFKGGKDMLSIYCNNYPDTLIFDGRGLAMGGSTRITEIDNKSYYDGDLSAVIVQNLPYWAEIIRVPKRSVALNPEWESKIEEMAQTTVQHNVTNILGVPSWTLLLLRRILEISGKKDIREVWPNLEVFFHGGVSFLPYREQFREIIPHDDMHYMETYNASEGFFGLQDRSDSDELLLMLDYGIFYEFIPIEEVERDNPKTLFLHEVEKDKVYAMVISTNGGLWRYLIGDTVRFTSTSPYRIKITGRTRNFINAVGEELVEDNATKALGIACAKCHAVVAEFTGAPKYFSTDQNAAHEWVVEFAQPPENIDFFAETFDNALKSLNTDYEAKRYHNMVLQPPVIHVAPPGTFYHWMKQKNKLGGQNKVPRLANHRKHLEELLQLLK
ncbi:MAG: GH3 auxin-responsive promoter family protein [Bacteroidales bacterium]